MKMLVKRLPNDGLYDLHEILIDEINSRKEFSRQVASLEFRMCKLPTMIINIYRDTKFYEQKEKWKKLKNSKTNENLKENSQAKFSSAVDVENG